MYDSAWFHFSSFCATFSTAVMPVNVSYVSAFIVHCFESRRMQPSSIKCMVAGIQFHLRCLDPSCLSLLENPSIRLLLNGLKREKPQGKDPPYGCYNWCSIDTRSRGITIHKFPSDTGLRRQWEVALRWEGFVATESSKLCSEHFKPDDFDMTGQIVRLRDGATPSVFNFPSHLQRDHFYALPNSPTHLKARLSEALARVESLEREKQNAKARERRAINTVKSLLEDMKEKNLINEELKERLDFHSEGDSTGWGSLLEPAELPAQDLLLNSLTSLLCGRSSRTSHLRGVLAIRTLKPTDEPREAAATPSHSEEHPASRRN
ncbi:hypothetical protein QQF64_034008 [Cirrhinus molitorella]|uniref:THAP-type domain-containing protein n=1 Tax=Cirrhinus molitorella TaxID=172907 RepID=A0ABR3MVS6_9TELE